MSFNNQINKELFELIHKTIISFLRSTNYIIFDDVHLKLFIRHYIKSLKILSIDEDVVENAIKYLSDYSVDSYNIIIYYAKELHGLCDVYEEHSRSFESWNSKVTSSSHINLDKNYNYFFKLSLYEEYVKLIKYYSQMLQIGIENKYQVSLDYFYYKIMNSVPIEVFVLFNMILQKYPEKENDLNNYVKNVILVYEYVDED